MTATFIALTNTAFEPWWSEANNKLNIDNSVNNNKHHSQAAMTISLTLVLEVALASVADEALSVEGLPAYLDEHSSEENGENEKKCFEKLCASPPPHCRTSIETPRPSLELRMQFFGPY